MTEFLLAAAAFLLGIVALGLARLLAGPTETDRLLAAQLLGTGGVAALLLFGVASGENAAVHIALVLALLAAFASVAFVAGFAPPPQTPPTEGDSPAEDDATQPVALASESFHTTTMVFAVQRLTRDGDGSNAR